MALTLKTDFVNDPNLDNALSPTYTVTRATTKTFTDWEDIIRTVPANVYAVDGARFVENKCIQSEDLTTTWTTPGSTVTINANAIAGPSAVGGMADEVVEADTSSTTHRLGFTAFTCKANTQYCVSVYVKEGTDGLMPTIYGGGGGFPNAAQAVLFDFATETIFTATNVDDSGFEDVGDGWYRIWYVDTTDAASTDFVQLRLSDASGNQVYAGTGSGSIYFTGVQYEEVGGQADTDPSEYQATTGAVAHKWYATKKDGSALDTAITGLLVEEARTNIFTYSDDLTNWATPQRATVTSNTVVAPDGTTTGDTLVEDGTSAQSHYIANLFTATDDLDYTASVYAKAANRNWLYFTIITRTGGSRFASFNLSDGTIGTVNGSATASIEDAGNGWYRCRVTANIGSGGTSEQVRCYIGEADNDNTFDGLTQDSLYLWGGQLEQATFPTSYIPTTTTSVTRNADIIRTDDVSAITVGQGTDYIKCMVRALESNDSAYCYGAGSSYQQQLFTDSNGRAYCLMKQNTVNQVFTWPSPQAVVANTPFQWVCAYDTNDVVIYQDGGGEVTDTSATPPTSIVEMNLGSNTADGGQLNGWIQEFRYYDTRLTNAEAQAMSNGTFPFDGAWNKVGVGLGISLGF